MIRNFVALLFFFIIIKTQVIGQETPPSYRVFVELKAGFQRESINLIDPGNKLSNGLLFHPTTGANIGVLLNNNRSMVTLEFDRMAIGNMPYFEKLKQGLSNDSRFLRFTPSFQHQFPLMRKAQRIKLSFFLKAGPSFTLSNIERGEVRNTYLEAILNDDTARYDNYNTLNRNFFAGLTLGGGILFTPNPRLRFSYSMYPSWNFSSNEVSLQDIEYNFFNNSTIYQAKATTRGTTLTHSIALGYAFGKTQQGKAQLVRKRRLYTDEEWEKRKRWSLIFHTSNTYPVIHLSDAGGQLTRQPIERFTYGAQVFYRIHPKWRFGTGVESVPFQLDARLPVQVGGSGTVVRNSYQIPFLAEYTLLETKGKVKLEWLARAGLALGLQRKLIADRENNFGVSIIQEPQYFWESETRDRPSTAFLAGLVGTRLNVHLSKNIFLTGYVQQQGAITQNTFHRSRATYQVGNPQAPTFEAALTTKGSVLLPGFGIGFQL